VLRAQVACEAPVKSELQKVRELAEARIRTGNLPAWSWNHCVALIEAIDTVMHDVSVEGNASNSPRRSLQEFRLLDRANGHNDNVREEAGLARKRGKRH